MPRLPRFALLAACSPALVFIQPIILFLFLSLHAISAIKRAGTVVLVSCTTVCG